MIRVGFIGCGGVAQEYRQRLLERADRARIVAVCDLDEPRACAFAEPLGAAAFTDWSRMLAEAELDAVFDNLPPFARGEELVAAAGAGCAIFSTKPLGLDLDTPRRNLAAVEAAGVANSVGYMFRYSAITDELRRRLDGRPPTLVVGQVYGAAPGGWVARRAMSGGQIVEQSTHMVDLARLLCGEVSEVFARGHCGASPGVDYEDSTAVTLAFANGAVGSILSTSAVRKFDWRLTVVARDLHLDLVYDAWTLRGGVDGAPVDLHLPDAPGYQEQIDAFLSAVDTGDPTPIRSSYRDGCATLAATLAANRALASGRVEPVERV